MSASLYTPAEGDILAGKYRVERVLGAGGMGVVVAATHVVLGQRVALKFLREEATPEVMERFLREGRAAVRLKSQHVARVSDVGQLESGAPYMVMEYLEGNDLEHVVRERGPLPVADAIGYLLDGCEAIAEAHSLGIIHRDLKPANLFLTSAADGSSTVKVLDFGISAVADAGSDAAGAPFRLTKTTEVMGSPGYMPPEQLRAARDATERSDIWSLGVILHELLTGDVPFTATSFADLILKVNTAPPTRVSSVRSDVPRAVEAAILRCLEKSPKARFASVGELAWALAEHGPKGAIASAERISRTLEAAGTKVNRPKGMSAGPDSQVARPAMTSVSGSDPPAGGVVSRLRDSLVLVGVVTAVAAGAAVGVYMISRRAMSPGEGSGAPATITAPVPPKPTAPSVKEPEVQPAPAVPTSTAGPVASAAPAATTAPAQVKVTAPTLTSVALPTATARATSAPTAPPPPTSGPKPEPTKANPLDIKVNL